MLFAFLSAFFYASPSDDTHKARALPLHTSAAQRRIVLTDKRSGAQCAEMLRKKPDKRRRRTSEGEPRRRGEKIMQSTDSSRARTFSAFEEAKERRMKKKNASDMNELW